MVHIALKYSSLKIYDPNFAGSFGPQGIGLKLEFLAACPSLRLSGPSLYVETALWFQYVSLVQPPLSSLCVCVCVFRRRSAICNLQGHRVTRFPALISAAPLRPCSPATGNPPWPRSTSIALDVLGFWGFRV